MCSCKFSTLPYPTPLPPSLPPPPPAPSSLSPSPLQDPAISDLWGIAALACWFLRQAAAGAASPFAPFIRSLPQHVPSPIFYPPHILERFDDSTVLEAVGRREGWGEVGRREKRGQ